MLVLAAIIVIAIIVLNNRRTSQVVGSGAPESPKTAEKEACQETEEDGRISVEDAYKAKWMFTQNEKRAYYKLCEIAQKHELTVFAKVRLLDLVEPVRNHPKYKTNFYRIQAKHVDFVLAKSNLVARYVIELDDSSHDTKTREERDAFVDKVLIACGYKVFRTREITEEDIVKLISQ